MKKLIAISLFLFSAGASFAQQVGMYSHSFYKPMIYNPAFTGEGNMTNVMVLSRAQWTDFSGAPQLNIASLDGAIADNKIGLGIVLTSDKKGLSRRTGGEVFYSYRLNINEDMHLRFGVSLGVVDHSFDYSKAVTESANDPTLFSTEESKIAFNGNAGLALVWKDLEFGGAVPQIIGNKVSYMDTSNVRGTYSHARHYMGSLKYQFFISKEKHISIDPGVMVRFVPNAPVQYDADLIFDWHDKFWIGGTYKAGYAASANAGFCVHKQLYVGYSYDFILGTLGKYSGMAHELMINFKFGRKKEEVPAAEKEKDLRNAQYERQLDSLGEELLISQAKQKQMSDKLDQLSKQVQEQKNQNQNASNPGTQSQGNSGNQNGAQQGNTTVQNQNPGNNTPASTQGNQNSSIGEGAVNKRMEGDVLIVSGKKTEFKNDGGVNPPKGYYVVIGTYFYRDLAEAETRRFVAKGYQTTDWVYSGPKNFNYIFMFKCKTKEEAIEKLKIARVDAGVKDAWIQEITD